MVEVTNVWRHGFWLLLDERELFLPFEEFPWFERGNLGDTVADHALVFPDSKPSTKMPKGARS